ncbi:MAG: hypothetical protein A3H35_10235 [Betaproteobacteria bacterium RIFCSPLOWO2_02_FULL_62_17]|nr:MAG: hypothetical protein A3H35_10235 [Betaproteobacteria bacterium RIFCSPLOWO2_02_FULL_62_17]
MKDLTSAERRALRARAHSLDPVVIIGNGGLTPGVIAEVERSLKAHELIKIRAGGMEHAERESAFEAICGQSGATQVQHIGKVLVVYRELPKEETAAAKRKPRKTAVPPGRRALERPSARPVSAGKAGGARSAAVRRGRAARG